MIATARILVLGASLLLASSAQASWEVKLGSTSGEVQTRAPRGKLQPASEGQTLTAGTRVQTGPGGSATLQFDDGARVELEGDSTLVVTAPPRKRGIPPVRFDLTQGTATTSSQSIKGSFVIRVPAGSVWLFGARAKVEVDGTEVRVSAHEGRVEVATVGRAAKLRAGQGVVAQKGRPAQRPYALEAQASAAPSTPSPAQEEKPAEQPMSLEGLGLDLTESTSPPQADESDESEETESAPEPAATETASAQEPDQAPAAPAEPMRLNFRAGVEVSPGAMFGLPNLFAGGTLKARGQLALFSWLELGLSLGFGQWARLGELVPDRPGYTALATLEAELAVRVPFGAPFAELGVGYRGFTVEEARRGYLVDTGPLALSVGGGYSLNVGLPLDVMLRVGAIPGTRTSFTAELHALVWVF